MRRGIVCCALIALLCVFACGCGSSTESDGRARIEALTQTTVADVQGNIQAAEEEKNAEAARQRAAAFYASLVDDQLPADVANEMLSGVVIMGDSLIQAISAYGFLDADHVVAEIGVSLYSAGPMVTRAAQLYPTHLVIAFGENDLTADNGDASLYIDSLRPVVQQVRDEIPGAKIYVASVLPPNEKAIAAEGELAAWSDFNNALIAYADSESDVTYIDTASVGQAHQDLLEPDGIHYREEFYPYYLAQIGRAIYS